jgi:Peptidase inhibitor family I36
MSYINNQTQDLYSIELVQDLDYETAATVSGGALRLWSGFNGTGASIVLTGAGSIPANFNNVASSYRVTGNQLWYGYTGFNYTGTRFLLTPSGVKNLLGNANNSISSVRLSPIPILPIGA